MGDLQIIGFNTKMFSWMWYWYWWSNLLNRSQVLTICTGAKRSINIWVVYYCFTNINGCWWSWLLSMLLDGYWWLFFGFLMIKRWLLSWFFLMLIDGIIDTVLFSLPRDISIGWCQDDFVHQLQVSGFISRTSMDSKPQKKGPQDKWLFFLKWLYPKISRNGWFRMDTS